MSNDNVILQFLRGYCNTPWVDYTPIQNVENKSKLLKCFYINTRNNNRVLCLQFRGKIIALKQYNAITLIHEIRLINRVPTRYEKIIYDKFNQGVPGMLQKFDLRAGLDYFNIRDNF